MPLGISSVKLRHLWGLPPFDANLLGMHRLPLRKSFAEATPATPNLLAASKVDIFPVRDSVEKWGLTPLEPDAPLALTLSALAPTQTLPGSGYSSPTIFDDGKWLLPTK